MYGVNKDCPIRITGLIGYDLKEIDDKVVQLIQEFGWKVHSRAELKTVNTTVYSVILFHTGVEHG